MRSSLSLPRFSEQVVPFKTEFDSRGAFACVFRESGKSIPEGFGLFETASLLHGAAP
jgi:hypothetical protein